MTNYICKNFKLSNLNIKEERHAVKFEPIIDNGNLVHHMILYSCEADLDDKAPEYDCAAMRQNCEFM